jgi:hypothetical protein
VDVGFTRAALRSVRPAGGGAVSGLDEPTAVGGAVAAGCSDGATDVAGAVETVDPVASVIDGGARVSDPIDVPGALPAVETRVESAAES